VIQAIHARFDIAISVDSSTPAVMVEAAEAGAGMVNDVRALRRPGALAAVAGLDVAICLMHMRGEPDTMQKNVEYEDVVAEVRTFLAERVEVCVGQGIARSRLVLDPGFGFGKSVEQNYQLPGPSAVPGTAPAAAGGDVAQVHARCCDWEAD